MSKTMTPNTIKFETDCRNCPHRIEREVAVGRKTVKQAQEGVHIRCKECRTTNYVSSGEP